MEYYAVLRPQTCSVQRSLRLDAMSPRRSPYLRGLVFAVSQSKIKMKTTKEKSRKAIGLSIAQRSSLQYLSQNRFCNFLGSGDVLRHQQPLSKISSDRRAANRIVYSSRVLYNIRVQRSERGGIYHDHLNRR